MNQLTTVRSLQQRISEMQPLRLAGGGVQVAPELRPLLPGGALRKGAPTSVTGSLQLALALLRDASAGGAWCGAIGLPRLGFEAAAQLGIALERFVVVPEAGRHTLHVAGMLSEVLGALIVRPAGHYSPADIERLHGKLREHGTALVVLGEWPRSDTSLQIEQSRWFGLERGYGMLDRQELTVCSTDRRGRRRHTVRFRGGCLATDPSAVADAGAALRSARVGGRP